VYCCCLAVQFHLRHSESLHPLVRPWSSTSSLEIACRHVNLLPVVYSAIWMLLAKDQIMIGQYFFNHRDLVHSSIFLLCEKKNNYHTDDPMPATIAVMTQQSRQIQSKPA
jgi:hypothetical protein